jgi:hypothetical protein
VRTGHPIPPPWSVRVINDAGMDSCQGLHLQVQETLSRIGRSQSWQCATRSILTIEIVPCLEQGACLLIVAEPHRTEETSRQTDAAPPVHDVGKEYRVGDLRSAVVHTWLLKLRKRCRRGTSYVGGLLAQRLAAASRSSGQRTAVNTAGPATLCGT